MSKKRIVFVSEFLGLECNSTSYYWTKILMNLERDFDILVVAPSSKENLLFLSTSAFEYITYDHFIFDKSSMLSRLLAYVKMCFSMFGAVKKNLSNGDIVISGTNPIFNMFFLSILKKKLGFKWILFGYDIFPENLIPGGIVKANNPIFLLAKLVFSKLYSSPTEIVAVGRDMQNLLRMKTDHKVPVHYIPNWADHNDTFPVDSSQSDDKVIFQFFGNMGRLQDIDNLLDAIPLVKSEKAIFSFVGDGGEAEKVRRFIVRMKDSRVFFKGPCPMSMRNETLSSCDVALISLKPDMYGLAVPSKSYFSLAANKPLIVIGDADSELRQLIKEFNLGWDCDAGSPIQLAYLIDCICENSKILSKMNVRDIMIDNFSEAASLAKINHIISTL